MAKPKAKSAERSSSATEAFIEIEPLDPAVGVSLELRVIRVMGIEALHHPSRNEPPNVLANNISIGATIDSADESQTVSVFDCKLIATYADDPNPKVQPLFIRCVYQMIFRRNNLDVVPSREQLLSFAHHVGTLVVWPYWRELVQSTTARMGLPSLTLPLIRAIQKEGSTDLAIDPMRGAEQRKQATRPKPTTKKRRKKRN